MSLLQRLLLLVSIVSFILLLCLAAVRAQGMGDTPLYLECGGIGTQPVDHDPDPVYKINITLVPHNGHINYLDVRFTAVSGAVYIRANQYSDMTYSEGYEGAMPMINWYGRWNKNPNVLMMGRILRNGARAWYNEMRQNGAAITMVMTSACHFIAPDVESKGD